MRTATLSIVTLALVGLLAGCHRADTPGEMAGHVERHAQRRSIGVQRRIDWRKTVYRKRSSTIIAALRHKYRKNEFYYSGWAVSTSVRSYFQVK